MLNFTFQSIVLHNFVVVVYMFFYERTDNATITSQSCNLCIRWKKQKKIAVF